MESPPITSGQIFTTWHSWPSRKHCTSAEGFERPSKRHRTPSKQALTATFTIISRRQKTPAITTTTWQIGMYRTMQRKKAIATLAKCLSSSVGFVPLSSSIPRTSFTESAPLQRSIPRENKNLNFFAIFSRLAIPSLASNSGNRPFGGRFAALSRPYPRLENPQRLPIAKKLQSMPLFCF